MESLLETPEFSSPMFPQLRKTLRPNGQARMNGENGWLRGWILRSGTTDPALRDYACLPKRAGSSPDTTCHRLAASEIRRPVEGPPRMVAGGGFEPPTFGLCDLTQLSLRAGLYLRPAQRDARHPVSTPSPIVRGLVRYCPIPHSRT